MGQFWTPIDSVGLRAGGLGSVVAHRRGVTIESERGVAVESDLTLNDLGAPLGLSESGRTGGSLEPHG